MSLGLRKKHSNNSHLPLKKKKKKGKGHGSLHFSGFILNPGRSTQHIFAEHIGHSGLKLLLVTVSLASQQHAGTDYVLFVLLPHL